MSDPLSACDRTREVDEPVGVMSLFGTWHEGEIDLQIGGHIRIYFKTGQQNGDLP